MKVLVIGGGGREHALVWKIKQSPLVEQVYCAPGNAGIAQDAICENISVTDKKALLNYARTNKIDLTVVGPEIPLVEGIVDYFEENGMAIFGPSEKAAELEGSKVFCKYILKKYDIPTADYRHYNDYDEARAYLELCDIPIVVKADGLAAGKGAIVCKTREEAFDAIDLIMKQRAFGEAGRNVIIEECMVGDEVSVMALSDGESLVYMVPSQDHKRIFDNDEGPNTGGMGAYAPTPHINEETMDYIKKEIMEPTIKGMSLEGRPYKGVLYAGIMLTPEGPKVLEYNVRFGDPETQVILPMAKTDFVETLLKIREGKLNEVEWENYDGGAVTVVIASGGYPGSYDKGLPIVGLDSRIPENVKVYHAGTTEKDGKIVTNGGRVLAVTARENSIEEAIDTAYKAVGKIAFDKAFFRRDIAARALRK